jgi:hypothetical protein
MIDILLTAGLNLAQNLIVEWVKNGHSRVPVAEVQSCIAREAQQEADRLRVRVDDLQRATDKMMLMLVERTPQLSYSRKFPKGPALNLDFDPRSPSSSKEMLNDLRRRVAEISADLPKPAEPDLPKPPKPDEAKALPRVTIEPGPDPGQDESRTSEKRRSAAMIEELRDRVRDAEGHRK